jgi:hypothetical protein
MLSDALGVLVMIAALLMIALSAASAEERSIEIRDDLGGNIDSYAATYRAIAREGEDVRVGGTCASACTFVLIYCRGSRSASSPTRNSLFTA